MNANQIPNISHQNYRDDDSTRRKLLVYSGGGILVIALIACVVFAFTCKIPFLNNFLPICRRAGVEPPTITKTYSPDQIKINEVSTLTYTLGNHNSVALTDVTFTDTVLFGLQVDDLSMAETTCGGEPTWAPSAGTTTLVFGVPAGATIPAQSSCTVSVRIKGVKVGSYTSVSGYISSSNGGVNISDSGKATASIAVVNGLSSTVTPPGMTVSFEPDQILPNDTSALTFTITNPNTDTALTGVTFSNLLPDGLMNGATLDSENTCNGTLKATVGGNSIGLDGGTVAAGETCTIKVNVTALTDGMYKNTNALISSENGGPGSVTSDTLFVGTVVPFVPLIALSKEISTSGKDPWTNSIKVDFGANIYYRFTVENKGNVPLSMIRVTDPTVNTTTCPWPDVLPAAVPGSENHIARCVIGPITAESGVHTNTATASGVYENATYTSPSATATYEVPSTSTPESLDVYLPEIYMPNKVPDYSSYIKAQLEEFNKSNQNVKINILYYSDVQSLQNNDVSGVFAIKSDDVKAFAQQELLSPITLPQDRVFLAEALASSMVNDQIFAYPWQREICSSNFTSLVISSNLSSTQADAANRLSNFLTNEANQSSNFDAWQIYPTLDSFYHGEVDFPEVSCKTIDQKAVDKATELSSSLSDKFDIKIDASLAKGLDTILVGGASGELGGMVAPVSATVLNEYPMYKNGWQVMGIFSKKSDLLDLNSLIIINKGLSQSLPLPIGDYILVCKPETIKSCLAVSINQGAEFQIDYEYIINDEYLTLSEYPHAQYEQGSIKKCFYIWRRRICIRVFR